MQVLQRVEVTGSMYVSLEEHEEGLLREAQPHPPWPLYIYIYIYIYICIRGSGGLGLSLAQQTLLVLLERDVHRLRRLHSVQHL